jgi:hypothetical protein
MGNMSALDAVTEALIAGLQAELKIDADRARYVVERALDAPLPKEENPMLGLEGKGLFARRLADHTPELLAKHFDWVCIPLINGARMAVNRDREWYRRAHAAGLVITGFDWLPTADTWERGLADAIGFCSSVGSKGFVLDAEAGFLSKPREALQYVTKARQLCDAGSIKLGFTSYGPGWNIGRLPWDVFCKGTDFSITQCYDHTHALDPNYFSRSIDFYRSKGATRIVLGLGLYRDKPEDTSNQRWRDPAELQAHLNLVGPGLVSVIFWPLAGAIPARLFPVLDGWQIPSKSTVRDVLTGLTPFGKLARD